MLKALLNTVQNKGSLVPALLGNGSSLFKTEIQAEEHNRPLTGQVVQTEDPAISKDDKNAAESTKSDNRASFSENGDLAQNTATANSRIAYCDCEDKSEEEPPEEETAQVPYRPTATDRRQAKKLWQQFQRASPSEVIVRRARKLYRLGENREEVEHRGSEFRGVSKNGGKWQAFIRYNKRKTYLGSFRNPLKAARLYDIFSLLNRGLKVSGPVLKSRLKQTSTTLRQASRNS